MNLRPELARFRNNQSTRPGVSFSATAAGAPVGPSGPLRQTYPVLPQIGPPFISTTRNTRYGRGVITPLNAPAGSQIVVTHNLGRVIQGYHVLANDSGNTTTPTLVWNNDSRTQISVIADTPMTNCLVWFF